MNEWMNGFINNYKETFQSKKKKKHFMESVINIPTAMKHVNLLWE